MLVMFRRLNKSAIW